MSRDHLWNQRKELIMEASSNLKRPKYIVVAGMHAAGKSTAAKHFSKFGYLPHYEIGWSFRQNVLFRDPSALTLRGANLEWFDRSVLELELKRDVFISSFEDLPHCIETWHIGNFAYARIRSPNLARELEDAFKIQARLMRPLFLVFSISKSVFIDRCILPDMSVDSLFEFYCKIFDITVSTLTKHGCSYRLVQNDGSVEELLKSLRDLLEVDTGACLLSDG